MDYLFVYGTLMQPFDNPFAVLLRRHAKLIGKGVLKGQLFCQKAHTFWYPVAAATEGNDFIKGEIYQLQAATNNFLLEQLDEYEGVDSQTRSGAEYLRLKRQIEVAGSGWVSAWVYFSHKEPKNLPKIEHGDFLEYLNKNSP